MARSRVIKPEFWSDEKLARVSLQARLLYIGLWNTSDDAGRTQGHPLWLRSQIFPYDTIPAGQIEAWLAELVNLRRILPYTVNGEQYYFIPGFLKHQKIQHPSPAKNPAPPQGVREMLVSVSAGAHEQTEAEAEAEAEAETEAEAGTEAEAEARPPARATGSLFDKFWSAYPKKRSKGRAEEAWLRLRPDDNLLGRMLDAIGWSRAAPEWQREGGKYIPYPATWLLARGWEDETGGPAGAREGKAALFPVRPVPEERKAREFTGPEELRAILERHGIELSPPGAPQEGG